jgi:hypothetical protein
MYNPENPLIVQSDSSVLVEVASPRSRRRLGAEAQLGEWAELGIALRQ